MRLLRSFTRYFKTMYILGISGLYHDSAAALILDGKILCAAQEERFTRIKHDASFPVNSIQFCLKHANIQLNDVQYIVFYDKPLLKFERLLETYLSESPKGFSSFRMAIPVWLREKLFLKDLLVKEFKKIGDDKEVSEKVRFSEHHLSHAASAFFPSPFKNAVVLTLDGVGEWATSTVCVGDDNNLVIEKELNFPSSLGLLYSAFTYYAGFKVNSGEYKLMGLAPYGEPKYYKTILDNLIDVKDDGSFRLNQDYFSYVSGLKMTNEKFSKLFGEPVRKPDSDELTQFHMDIAASIQAVTEFVVLKITRSLAREYEIPNLCMAGGVALNCVANGKIVKDNSFKNLWVQPAAGDAGGALGAALAFWHCELNGERTINVDDSMDGSFLGPSFNTEEISKRLSSLGAVFDIIEDDDKLLDVTAEAISAGNAVGWFQGRMEFGPRALGGRSILADPRSPKMQSTLNKKIKFRESFRPFAPSILNEQVSEWFDLDSKSPYMLLVADVTKSKHVSLGKRKSDISGLEKLSIQISEIPAVTHVDYSARVQTVHKETNPRYYELINKFYEKTGCPILVNTSFNVRGEPIVCSPDDAFRCFMGTNLDYLVIGNCVLSKDKQDRELGKTYHDSFPLD